LSNKNIKTKIVSENEKTDNLQNYFKSLNGDDCTCNVYTNNEDIAHSIWNVGEDYLELINKSNPDSTTSKLQIVPFGSIRSMELSARHTEGGFLKNGKSFYTLRIDIDKSALIIQNMLSSALNTLRDINRKARI
jgi:hypothetical protein